MNDGIDWAEVAEVFADALEQPPDLRPAVLDQRCGDRADIRAAVERLLQAEAAADARFLSGLDPAALEAVVRAVDAPIARAGRYRIVREIGRGGMGQVFLAERDDGEFEQRVAIKLLKRGMDSDSILARFLRERQILARLEHPNIARLIDGGVTEDGRPYFVMEHAEGEPITEHCDRHRLSVDERLDLFQTVCHAVEHAHRNLVVHRDLKPSNILVTADGRPKLLDFGIAKLLSAGEEMAATTLTQLGARMLTPEYAAPEQLAGGPISTSTDVYGLGAVLYELLTGRRPVAPASNVEAQLRRVDREPPLLSVSVSGSSAGTRSAADDSHAPESIAARRAADPERLRRRLRGDLDTIVATALRSAPERRYASVEALRGDILRHQQRLPVMARPDTAGYRLSRFVNRHRTGVLAGAAAAALVLAFAVTAAVQANRIQHQAVALETERDRARREAAAAERVSDFLVGVFEVADPMTESHGDSIRARELLDRGAEQIDAELDGQPELQARMLSVIGRAYHNLGLSDRAEPAVQRALEVQRMFAGDDGSPVVAALQLLARVKAKRGDVLGADTVIAEAIAIQERIDPRGVTMWALLVDRAYVLHARGDARNASAAAAEATVLFDRLAAANLEASRETLPRMAGLLSYSRDREVIDNVHARWVEIETETMGPTSAPVAAAYASWGEALGYRGDLQAADSMHRIGLAIHRQLDPTSLATGHALGSVARVAAQSTRYEDADSLFRHAIEIVRSNLGDDHRLVAMYRDDLGGALRRIGRLDEAIALHQLAIAAYRGSESDVAIVLPNTEWRLGTALRDAGRLAESLVAFDSALRRFEAGFPPDYLVAAYLRREYGAALVDAGRAGEAEPMLRHAIDVLAARWGENDARVDTARIALGHALDDLNRYVEAEETLGSALSRLRSGPGVDDDLTRRAQDALDALERARSRGGS